LLHRELAGTGLRVKLFYGEKSKLNIGTAYIFEHEEYDFENDPSREKKANKHRWSNYLSYRLFLEDIIAFSSVLYVQPNFSDFRDYRILNENSFVVDISGKFSLGIEFNLRYDNKLPKDVKKLDTKTTVGLIYYF
jgi:putative salt-induced outer membrane protein YdiY